jgi:hypothetical protein
MQFCAPENAPNCLKCTIRLPQGRRRLFYRYFALSVYERRITARLPKFYFSTIVECGTFPRMSDSSFSSGTPQFSTAEYASKGGPDRCKSCNQPIADTYYRVNGALACPTCAQVVSRNAPKDSHTAFVRGVTFGVGGAVLGMILYAAVGILTGLMIGYVALAVGYVVAKAIKMGSGGMGGRRYQIAAALLTYAAVSIAAVPIGISQYVKARDARAAARTQHLQRLPSEDAPSAETGAPDSSADPAGTAPAAPARHPASLSGLLGSLLLAGLASPFMELWTSGPSISAIIGLFILFIGIRIAWQMTAGSGTASVIGPFKG